MDVLLVVKLRRTLKEKIERFEKHKKNNMEASKKDASNSQQDPEEVVKNAIKLVILNNGIGILFKLPLCFRPIVFAIAQFVFKYIDYELKFPLFYRFFVTISPTSVLDMIHEFSECLFTLFISLQFFIYLSLDKKFKLGYNKYMRRQAGTNNPKNPK